MTTGFGRPDIHKTFTGYKIVDPVGTRADGSKTNASMTACPSQMRPGRIRSLTYFAAAFSGSPNSSKTHLPDGCSSQNVSSAMVMGTPMKAPKIPHR